MNGPLYIVGAGAHACKAYHCATGMGFDVLAFADDALTIESPVPGVPIVSMKALEQPVSSTSVFVAIGDAGVRKRLMKEFVAAGWRLAVLIHPTAWVAPDAIVREGAMIAAGAVVESRADIGRGVIIDIGVLVDHDAVVAAYQHLRPGQVVGPYGEA